MDDPITSGISKDVILYPEELHLNLGTLSLSSPRRVDTALALLVDLNFCQYDARSVFHLRRAGPSRAQSNGINFGRWI